MLGFSENRDFYIIFHMLQVGIVGLPNVGKSTLFNALTRSRKAEAANYPFCTIEPNVGVVQVPDDRLAVLAKVAKTGVIVPAAIEFVDIAGLVKGASQGEGLGNQFLANIRQVDAIVHVVRCFEDKDIIHNMGGVDPLRDIEIIATELMLADLESCEAQIEKTRKKARANDKEALANLELLEAVLDYLKAGKPVNTLPLGEEDAKRLKTFGLLSSKPVVFACNMAEKDLGAVHEQPYFQKVAAYVKEQHQTFAVPISVKLEAELSELSKEEAQVFLEDLGLKDSGVSALIKASYDLLGLASYFTAGEKEVHAWTFKKGMKAPACAGVIHTDFEKGFIKAEVVSYEDLVTRGSVHLAKEAGKYRLEGKEYVVQDGDVIHFRFA